MRLGAAFRTAVVILAFVIGSDSSSTNAQGLPLRRYLQESSDASYGQSSQGSNLPQCQTPWQIFNSSQELSFWAEALQEAGFSDEVNSPFVTATFFAPTNDAFAALLHALGSTPQQLLSDPSIVPILLYHMLPGQYDMVEDFDLGDQLLTAISTNLTIGAASAPAMAGPTQNTTVVTVQSAQSVADIIKYNITACMAVIHELDQVLVPEFLNTQTVGNRILYQFGDGSGSGLVVTNFTLILPSPNQNVSDISDPVYQLTDAGLMFSLTPGPV